MWLDTSADKVDWMALLKEDWTNTFQTCICLHDEGLAEVILFEYGCTGNLSIHGICLSMFRSPNTWYVFLGKLSQAINKFSQSWSILVQMIDCDKKPLEVFHICIVALYFCHSLACDHQM